MFKILAISLGALLLVACSAETATTAATAGVAKKQELEQGQKIMEQVQQQVGESVQQMQQRTEGAAD